MLDLLDAPRFVDPERFDRRRGHNARPRDEHWTEEEIALLAKTYPRTPQEELLRLFPTRTWSAIKIKATKTGIRRCLDMVKAQKGERWVEGEAEMLQLFYPHAPKRVLKAIWPNRSWMSLMTCAHRYGITRQEGMTRISAADRDVIEQINELGKVELCRRVPHLTYRQMYRKAFEMGIEVKVLPQKDLDLIWEMFTKDYAIKDIATMVDTSKQMVGRALNHLKAKYNYQD